MEKVSYGQVAEIRHRVQAAFGELRKIGFIARSNFSCCMSCATYELSEIAEKKQRNRVAYWHHQDETRFKKDGALCIRYFYLPSKEIEGDTTSLETQTGEQIAAALRKAGLNVDWNGNPDTIIEVTGVANQHEPEKEVTNATNATI